MRLLTQSLAKRLAQKQLALEITDEAVDLIVEKGYDPVYGARPLKRFIQHTLETTIAKSILGGNFTAGDTLKVCLQKGELTVKKG